jgi:hypothetical protein
MSNAVIHPLLDAAIIQLNSLRVMLGDQPAIHLIDGAKSQLVATKHMLGNLPDAKPQLPAMGYTGHADIDAPQKVGEPAPRPFPDSLLPVQKKKEKGKRKGSHRGYADPTSIREAVTLIIDESSMPISKNEIDDLLVGNEKKYNLDGRCTIYSTKAALNLLVKTEAVRKLGERASARYTSANK